jgi:PKHD-type hydroxylase
MHLGKINNGTSPDYRNSKIVFIQPVAEIAWVYRKLTDVVLSSNNAHFKFDLFSFGESLQFTQYDAPSGKYNYHVDKVVNGPIRKLSMVLQLSDEQSYEGGEFEILDSDIPEQLPRKQGTVLLFPSYTMHRVTEVTKGTRHSLVGWINGPMFK